jgi:uncharacterized membrane protein
MKEALKQFGGVLLKYPDIIIKYFVSIAVTYAFVQVVYTITHHTVPTENEKLFIHLVGIIEGIFGGSLVAYYWTKSHNKKEEEENHE